MLVSEDKVREELKKVIDPELFVNIVDLGLIYNIEITPATADDESATAAIAEQAAAPETTPAATSTNDSSPTPEAALQGDGSSPTAPTEEPYDGLMANVTIEMTMTSPACPAGPQLIGGSKNVVSRMKEVRDVEVKLVMDPPWTPDRMTEDARDQLGIF
jgi:metal-sulfur cluster biosynthetic enzyme